MVAGTTASTDNLGELALSPLREHTPSFGTVAVAPPDGGASALWYIDPVSSNRCHSFFERKLIVARYRFTHYPSGFVADLEYAPSTIRKANYGDRVLQNKIRSKLYAAVGKIDDRKRRLEIQSEYDEFLWIHLDVEPL